MPISNTIQNLSLYLIYFLAVTLAIFIKMNISCGDWEFMFCNSYLSHDTEFLLSVYFVPLSLNY